MRNLVAAVLSLLLIAPAVGASTAWQELAPGVKLRLIAGAPMADGKVLAALDLEMPTDTRTYWRIPGEGGIPAEVDIAGSTGVEMASIVWPYPTVDRTAGYTDFVYWGPTVLPLELTIVGAAATLQARVTLGICSDICVPAQARFSLPLDAAAADPAATLRIQQALATAPIAWDQAGEPFGSLSFDAATGELSVPVSDPSIDPASVLADAGVYGPLFGAPQKSPDGKLALLPLLGGLEGVGDLKGRSIHLTFMTHMGPYELSRTIGP